MSHVQIRTATKQDLATLLAFEQGIIEFERAFDCTLGENPISYYNLAEIIDESKALVLVAEVTTPENKQRIVASGFAQIRQAKPFLDHDFYVYCGFMYVEPDFRGQGINARIMQKITQWGKAQGVNEMRLTVYSENTAAIKAYQKVGMQQHLIEMRMSLDD
ncbi:N-acetyltransferase family protein [Aliikangiella sp. IMCC44653]